MAVVTALFGLLRLSLAPITNKALILLLFALFTAACVLFGWKWGLSDAEFLSLTTNNDEKSQRIRIRGGVASGRWALVIIALGSLGGVYFAKASTGKASDMLAFCLGLFFTSPFFSFFSGYYRARTRADRLRSDAAWREWPSYEARTGSIRAELCLARTEDGGRTLPVPPHGVLSPMWDIGHLTPEDKPALDIAQLWIESRDPLEPGECASVRLLPETFEHWRHLTAGDVITMHETAPLGTARIVRTIPPVTTLL